LRHDLANAGSRGVGERNDLQAGNRKHLCPSSTGFKAR
jgi:hypothetical protein